MVLPAGASLDSRSVSGVRVMMTSYDAHTLFRFRAELEADPELEHCFLARLTVEGAEAGDSRQYVVRWTHIHTLP